MPANAPVSVIAHRGFSFHYKPYRVMSVVIHEAIPWGFMVVRPVNGNKRVIPVPNSRLDLFGSDEIHKQLPRLFIGSLAVRVQIF